MGNVLNKPTTWLLACCLAATMTVLSAVPAFATNYSDQSTTYNSSTGEIILTFKTTDTFTNGSDWGFYFYTSLPEGLDGISGSEKWFGTPEGARYENYEYSYNDHLYGLAGDRRIVIKSVTKKSDGSTVDINDLSGTFYIAAGPITAEGKKAVDGYLGKFTYIGKDSPAAFKEVSGTLDAGYLPATVTLEAADGKIYTAIVDQTTGNWTASVPPNATYTVSVASGSGDYEGASTITVGADPMSGVSVPMTQTQQGKDKEAFAQYQADEGAAVASRHAAGESAAVAKLIDDAQAAVAAYVYDPARSLDENKAELAKIAAQLDADLKAQQDKEALSAFEDYRANKVSDVMDLHSNGESDAVKKIIDDGLAAIKAYPYDATKTLDQNKAVLDKLIATLNDEVESQEAADELAADKSNFEAYRTTKASQVAALHEKGESADMKALINAFEKAIADYQYDESKTLDQNKVELDKIISNLKIAINEQKTNELKPSKQIAKDTAKTKPLVKTGDRTGSDICFAFATLAAAGAVGIGAYRKHRKAS